MSIETDPEVDATETETEAVTIETNVRIERYEGYPEQSWTNRSKHVRKSIRQSAHTPVSVAECHNVSCVGLHEYLPALLNFHNTYDRVKDHPDAIAFGSSSTNPTSSDTSLNNRVGSVTLTDPSNSGTEWSCTELVGSLELNGEDLVELGVEGDSGALYNHALLPDPLTPKTSTDELIVTITISFASA
jgi:hypothetical protein